MARHKSSIKHQLPSLDTGPLPLESIRDQARKQLIDIIDSRRGKKALILEPSISGPLTLLDTGLSELLTEHGVVKLLYLEDKRLDDASYNFSEPRLLDVQSIIYIVRSNLDNAQLVAKQVKQHPKGGHGPDFSVFFVPRRTIAAEKLLEEEGVYGDLALGEFALDLVPLESDVLSLELDAGFKECVLEGDGSSLFAAARAIVRLQRMFGLVPRMQGKGPAACAVRDMVVRMLRESPVSGPPGAASVSAGGGGGGGGRPRIDRVLLLDREVDVVTPMMTQITFEGLIDEVTGVKHGTVSWAARDHKGSGDGAGPSEVAGKGGGSVLLNSSLPFYAELRDLPYYTASERLKQLAREAKKEYSELDSKNLGELKTFLKGLPKVMLLDKLSDLAAPVAEVVRRQPFHDKVKTEQDIVDGYDIDAAVNFIQELMWRGGDLVSVLRLLVLLSATCGGVARKALDTLRQELLVTYGHLHLLTLNNLDKAGLLRGQPSGSKSQFGVVRKALRLMTADDDPAALQNPTDISHIYKGYAPLSIRLVEAALRGGGWSGAADALAALPGQHFDVSLSLDPNGQLLDKQYKAPRHDATGTSSSSSSFTSAPNSASGGPALPPPETVLVVFLGGCTFAEISALRFLASRPAPPARFVVLTTKVLTGAGLLRPFLDPLATHAAKTCAAGF